MRIKDLPEATELAEDDYLVLASEGGGACKILAKKFEPVLLRINAVYTQTETVYDDTPLDDLKTDLVVTAYYQGGGSRVINDYILSGTLEVGSSIITVSYKGKTDTIIVEVSSNVIYLYKWDFTKSLTDEIQGQVATLNSYSEFHVGEGIIITPDLSVSYKGRGGITLYDGNDYWLKNGITIEIDIPYAHNTHTTGDWSFLLQVYLNNGFGFKHSRYYDQKWGTCVNSISYNIGNTDPDIISNKTVKMELIDDDLMRVYVGNENDGYTLIYEGKSITAQKNPSTIAIGSFDNYDKGYNNFIVSGVRVYEER
jgi:hypothetical protein